MNYLMSRGSSTGSVTTRITCGEAIEVRRQPSGVHARTLKSRSVERGGMDRPVMPNYDRYERARQEFSWDLPERYNPARYCLHDGQGSDPADQLALFASRPDASSTSR